MYIRTNEIHWNKCAILQQVFDNMPSFTEQETHQEIR